MKLKKKGFTIIELVIVIAVIGILTAILIPTFMGITDKAHQAENETFVRNINTQLAINEASGSKNPTMYEAIKDAQAMGFHVDEITPYNDNDIIWDSIHDRFAIVKKEYAATDVSQRASKVVYSDGSFDVNTPLVKLWKCDVRMPASDDQHYSIYAKKAWSVTETAVNTKVGFDVGENTNITTINYTHNGGQAESQEVVIRTNSIETALTVNGYVNPSDASKGDVIRHYGAVGSVDIISVANASYHEYGKVAFMEIAKGRAALESGSQVTQIHISTQVTAVADDGTKTKTANTFDSITIALANDIEAPEFSRDAVSEIAEGGTLVVALQEGTVDANASKDYVWLYQQGVIQQMVVTTTSTFDANSKATDYEESSNTYQVADDIANNFTGSNTWENVAKDENGNITEVDVTSDSGLTETVKEFEKEQAVYSAFVEEKIAEYEGQYWIDAHSNSFNGGSGTEDDPYLISTPMELALVAYNVNNNIDNGSYAGAYYKLTANIDLSSKYWTGIGTWQYPFHGSIDGKADEENVYEIKGMHDGGIATQGAIFRAYTTRTVGGPYGLISVAGSQTDNCNLTVKNLKFTNVEINLEQGNSVGVVIGYAPQKSDFGITFTNPTDGNQYITDDRKMNGTQQSNYKYAFYFAEENRWYKDTTYKIGDTYYQGKAGAVGVGNYALDDITIDNVSVQGNITVLDCSAGIIGKAYSEGVLSITNCNIDCKITSAGGRAAGIAGYASLPSGVIIKNNTISGSISATATGVAPDYLSGSRFNENNELVRGDGVIIETNLIRPNTDNNNVATNTVTCEGNSFTGEIWYQGKKCN